MKKLLLLSLFTITFLSSFSQTKTLLTKDETISYINKKLNETIGHDRTTTNAESVKVEYCGMSKLGSGKLLVEYKGYDYGKNIYEFNPADIKEIKDGNMASYTIVGVMKVILKGKTGIYKYEGETKSVDIIYVQYLKSDQSSFNKISKAFFYLRDLYKTEEDDDPFGN